jgi:septation ring formation regulator EzrA
VKEENIINREINGLKMKMENIKEELTLLWKTSEKRIKPKHKIEIKGKTEELLVKQLKTCKRNIQELTNSIKRPKLSIMGIDKGEELQAKGIHNMFNKLMTENFPNLKKVKPIQVLDASKTTNRLDQNRTSL